MSKIDKEEYYNIRWKTSYGYVPLYIKSRNNTVFCKIGRDPTQKFTLIQNKNGLRVNIEQKSKKQEMLSILEHAAFMFDARINEISEMVGR